MFPGPGTFGTLWGLPLAWALSRGGTTTFVVGLIGIILLAVWVCEQAQHALGRHDPGEVVFDEIAAFPLAVALVPVDAVTLALAFAWFRLFDITKPWPVRVLERWPRGWGVVADDVAAAAIASVCVWGTHTAWQQWAT